MIYNNALEMIGNTPILKLNNLISDKDCADIYLKIEKNNPGGSIKDRAALGMIEPAELVEFVLENKLEDVTVQVQLHKIIWDPNKRGV